MASQGEQKNRRQSGLRRATSPDGLHNWVPHPPVYAAESKKQKVSDERNVMSQNEHKKLTDRGWIYPSLAKVIIIMEEQSPAPTFAGRGCCRRRSASGLHTDTGAVAWLHRDLDCDVHSAGVDNHHGVVTPTACRQTTKTRR